jgi:glycine/D-amino acid oxidase-like deaminating enzyme
MLKIVIIGSGIIGATIAYELSKNPSLSITLIDQQEPASGSTGAALGILIGYLSQKMKGRAWNLRRDSMEIYETLLPELEELTGIKIPCNRQGIVKLLFEEDNLEKWQNLINTRAKQGYTLGKWDLSQLKAKCPQIQDSRVIGAIYSPGDRQINPTVLTKALVQGASIRGVNCIFGQKVQKIVVSDHNEANKAHCTHIQLGDADIEADWIILASGIGTDHLISSLEPPIPQPPIPQFWGESSKISGSTDHSPKLGGERRLPLEIRPVLGQALLLKGDQVIGNPDFQPVITGNDIHIAPLGNGEYWIGATVEFPNEQGEVIAQEQLLEEVRQQAIALCPSLANATVMLSWSGKRPRPEGKPAPVIELLSGYENIILATGHYRNGILLATATAKEVCNMISA